jgi:hypothetical protein
VRQGSQTDTNHSDFKCSAEYKKKDLEISPLDSFKVYISAAKIVFPSLGGKTVKLIQR